MLSNGIQSGSFVGCDSEIMCFCYWAVRICSSVCGLYLATVELLPCMYYFYSSCQLSWTYNLLPVSVWAEKMLQKHFPGDLLWTTDWNEKIWNKSGYKTVVYVYIFCFHFTFVADVFCILHCGSQNSSLLREIFGHF